MGRELEYYHENKLIINLKRKLKYKLKTNKISEFQYNLEMQRLNNNLKDQYINEELVTEIVNLLDDCNYNELLLLKKEIEKRFN